MATPATIASVVIDNQSFTNWESIIVERSMQDAVSYATLTCAEPGPLNAGFQGLKIGPGQIGSVYLAGQLALSQGTVDLRQVHSDKNSHGVQIRIMSKTQNVLVSTVAGSPGQYTKSTLQAIGTAVCQPLGVNFQVLGNPPGADLPFERVSEPIGQLAFDFLKDLASRRHMFFVDDAYGNLNCVRGGYGTPLGSADPLVEGPGGNIQSERVVMEFNYLMPAITVKGQNFGNDDHWGEQAQNISATVNNPNPVTGFQALRRCIVPMEGAGNIQEATMRAQHELAALTLTSFEAVITVPGWLMSNGNLWLSLIGTANVPVVLNAPMIFPSNTGASFPPLYLKGVSHIQDNNEGTRTELTLCFQNALGGPEIVGQPSGT
jgi:prophage tail gpP-like protein